MVLVARTRAALDTLATQIEGAGGEAAVECCDMASTDQVIVPRVANEVREVLQSRRISSYKSVPYALCNWDTISHLLTVLQWVLQEEVFSTLEYRFRWSNFLCHLHTSAALQLQLYASDLPLNQSEYTADTPLF